MIFLCDKLSEIVVKKKYSINYFKLDNIHCFSGDFFFFVLLKLFSLKIITFFHQEREQLRSDFENGSLEKRNVFTCPSGLLYKLFLLTYKENRYMSKKFLVEEKAWKSDIRSDISGDQMNANVAVYANKFAISTGRVIMRQRGIHRWFSCF